MNNKHIKEAAYINIADRKVKENKRAKKIQRVVSSAVVLLVAGFLIIGGANLVSATANAYVLSVDGEKIATMVSESEAQSAIDMCLANEVDQAMAEHSYSVSYTNDVKIKQSPAVGAVYSSVSEAADMLSNNLHLVAEAVVLMVDGQETLYVADEANAIQAVTLAKAHYGDINDENVENIYTAEQISMSKAQVECSDVLTAEQASNVLIYGQPTVTADTEAQPKITVMVERTSTDVVPLPYEVVRIDDNSIMRGQEEVVTAGVNGTQEVTMKLTEINGVVAESEQLSATVITPAVEQVVNVGTKLIISSRSSDTGSGEFGWPLASGVGTVSSRFGWRSRGWHSGVDLAAPMYSVIYAAESGTVTFTDYNGGYGLLVMIDHGNGIETRYAHCDEILVSVGDYVERGAALATIGMTGTTTGPHVHFEIRIDGTAVDPLPYIE